MRLLPLLKKEVVFFGSVCLSVCLFVCLSVGLLANLWTDFDEIFWRGRAWLKDQVLQFWWRSGSRFESGSPKSEIRILRIGGGLCSLSTSSYGFELVAIYHNRIFHFLLSAAVSLQFVHVCLRQHWQSTAYRQWIWPGIICTERHVSSASCSSTGLYICFAKLLFI